MTKSELIQWVAEQYPKMSLPQSELVVNTLFQTIKDSLMKGERVELRGFGSFSLKQHNPHTGRNPKTGELVQVDAKQVPYFKPGKALREQVKHCR